MKFCRLFAIELVHYFIHFTDCKHSIEDRTGNITNVGYPEVDVTIQDCDWIINLQSGSHVKLQIVDIDLPLATLKGQCLVSKVMIGGYDYYGHRVILKEVSVELFIYINGTNHHSFEPISNVFTSFIYSI